MSLVSLALVFGLLATYYIVTVPWNRTAVAQALAAGGLFGVVALVFQFIPIRVPVPVSTEQQAHPDTVPTRSFRPEPEFEPEHFEADLTSSAAPVADGIGIATAPSPFPSSGPALNAAPSLASKLTASGPLPGPTPVIPVAEPTVEAPGPAPASLEKAILEADPATAEDTITMTSLKETPILLRGRNDDVLIDEMMEPIPVMPVPEPIASPREPTPPRPEPRASSPVVKSIELRRVTPPRNGKTPDAKTPEWQAPDRETPPELLQELADYWHVRFETERSRRDEALAKYEEVVRRLEDLERRTSPLAIDIPGTSPIEASPAAPLDEMTVEDADLHEDANAREERWDRRTAEMERFH